jgi:hypothetical protein
MNDFSHTVAHEGLQGMVTEVHLGQAEEEFPGISRFYAECPCKPRTFLELVARFEHWCTAH